MAAPAKKAATYQDVLDAPAHLVAEIIGGELRLSPRPGPLHQAAAGALSYQLFGPFRFGRGGPGGWLFLEEPELHLEARERPIVPDLAGWKRERMAELPESAAIELPPDWACEILSPRTEQIDRTDKMPVYAGARVPHLWLVNPTLQLLEAHVLDGRDWRRTGAWRGDACARVPPFEAIELELALLWSR